MAKIDYETANQMIRIQKYSEIANYEKVVKLGIDTMWKKLCDQVKNSDIDPSEMFEEEMENLRNMEYRMGLMNICCLSETWEQDLFNFLKEKSLTDSHSNDYNSTRRKFEEEYTTCPISNYPLIIEMRALVNAIKHGEGGSFTNIRRLTADTILADSNFGIIDENGVVIRKKQIEFDPNTLTSRTLNIEGKLPLYSEAIIKFWQDVFEADKAKTTSPTLE